MAEGQVSRIENRVYAIVTGLALFFGGWWLQNMYDTTLRLQEQFAEYMRFVDDKYVQKDYLARVEGRLDRIERKIDGLKDDGRHP